MNNIMILGKVVEKTCIHFDYFNKLNVYFKIKILEDSNIFEIVISEKYIGIDMVEMMYADIAIDSIIYMRGNIVRINDNYLILCNNIVVC